MSECWLIPRILLFLFNFLSLFSQLQFLISLQLFIFYPNYRFWPQITFRFYLKFLSYPVYVWVCVVYCFTLIQIQPKSACRIRIWFPCNYRIWLISGFCTLLITIFYSLNVPVILLRGLPLNNYYCLVIGDFFLLFFASKWIHDNELYYFSTNFIFHKPHTNPHTHLYIHNHARRQRNSNQKYNNWVALEWIEKKSMLSLRLYFTNWWFKLNSKQSNYLLHLNLIISLIILLLLQLILCAFCSLWTRGTKIWYSFFSSSHYYNKTQTDLIIRNSVEV